MTEELKAMIKRTNEAFSARPIVYLSKQQMIDQECWDDLIDTYGEDDEIFTSSDDSIIHA